MQPPNGRGISRCICSPENPQDFTAPRRLAEIEHFTVEDAVRQALEARAHAGGLLLEPSRPRDRSPEAAPARRAGLARIVRDIAGMSVLDTRSAQDIMDDLNDA